MFGAVLGVLALAFALICAFAPPEPTCTRCKHELDACTCWTHTEEKR